MFAVSRVENCCCDCRSYSAVLTQKTATNQSEPHFYRFDPTTVSDLGPSLIRLEEVWTPYKVDDCVETNARSMSSMRLINVKAFLEREELIGKRKRVDRRAKVLEFSDDRATEYAVLSHRWVGQEVDYDEMVELAKMDRKERRDSSAWWLSKDPPELRAGSEGRIRVVVGRHLLYRQAKQRRTIRGHQFHVSVV